tara:strand:- start:603 stop:1367 length:765 start_codon:yes stop_codon:yes gene_type:complete
VRLNILNDYVDYFVIVEGNKTWQNNPKKLKFDLNKFDKFKKKIIYVPVKDLPDGQDPYLRENFQRNCILRGLNNSNDNDLIIISDLDEIPNPNEIKLFNPKLKYAAFKQRHFYYKFNLQSEKNPFWIGSRICIKKFLKSPQWLRQLKFKKRPFWRIDKRNLNNIIENGGWHFCNLKSPEQLLYKYQNLCETNDPIHFKEEIDKKHLNIDEIKKKIISSKDIIGRNDSFRKVNFDSTFPDYIIKNKLNYKNLIEL